jgi:tRNA(adenine34) deaminase
MMKSTDDEGYMHLALRLAREAEAAGEVPVGAVIVQNNRAGHNEIIGTGRNSPIRLHYPTAHAEMLALRAAARHAENHRLDGATIYVTLEPCVMCAGALVAARLARVVFGARDLRFGGVRSKFRVADSEVLNHRLTVEEGMLGAECTELLQRFFALRR